MKKTFALLLALAMVLSLSAVACADDAKPGDGLYIGVVYKQSGNPYFQAGVDGFQKAADELGFTFEHDGPEDGSNDGQIRIIQNFIDKGVDALCVSANDADGLVDSTVNLSVGVVLILSVLLPNIAGDISNARKLKAQQEAIEKEHANA